MFFFKYFPKLFSIYVSGTSLIYSWKSNGMSEKNIGNIIKSDNNFAQTFVNHHVLPQPFS